MSNENLIARAAAVLHPYTSPDDYTYGDVAAALLTTNGNTFVGVCIDTTCGTGFCAEHSAIAAMVTAGEYQIARIVAVWRDDKTGAVAVVPPCGRCREFIRQIHPDNLDAEVILGRDLSRPLRELLPFNEWPQSTDALLVAE